MPILNGQKMACAPCIRGHRSTSCKHAHERLMIPVRKPGRPLSQCPHPPGSGCACGGECVTAALPRKKKCPCGSGAAEADALPADGEPLSPGSPPPSSAKGAYRVQKSGAGTRAATRTQSLEAALERIHPDSVQVVDGYSSAAASGLPVGMNGLAAPGQGAPVPYGVPMNAEFMQQLSSYEGLVFAPGHQTIHSLGQALEGAVAVKKEAQDPPATNGHGHAASQAMPVVVPVTKSCCGGGEPATNGSGRATPRTGSSELDGQKKQERRSCCSSKSEAPEPAQNPLPAGMEGGHGPAANGHAAGGHLMAGFQPPVALNSPVYPGFMQQAVYAYPVPYGSFQPPLQPPPWPAAVPLAGFGPLVAPGPPAMPMLHPAPYMMVDGAPNSVDTSHICMCGDSCNCLGCPAHPYNEQTQQYVRAAWASQMAAAPSSRSSSNGGGGGSRRPTEPASPPPARTDGRGDASHPDGGGAAAAAAPQRQRQRGSPGAASPTPPSDAASGSGGEEQTLSASDFFFVDYTGFGGECGGDTATCPCGGDCACLGCVIHGQRAVAS